MPALNTNPRRIPLNIVNQFNYNNIILRRSQVVGGSGGGGADAGDYAYIFTEQTNSFYIATF